MQERFGGFSLAHAVAARIGRGDVLIQFLRTRNVSRHFRYPRIGSLVLRENEIEKAHGHISQKSRIVVRFPGVRIPIEVVRARHIGVVGVISLISVGTARRRIRRIVAARLPYRARMPRITAGTKGRRVSLLSCHYLLSLYRASSAFLVLYREEKSGEPIEAGNIPVYFL